MNGDLYHDPSKRTENHLVTGSLIDHGFDFLESVRQSHIYLPQAGAASAFLPISFAGSSSSSSPRKGQCSANVDEWLLKIPTIVVARDNLFTKGCRRFTRACPEKILYVSQGEVAHAVSSQCDLIVSDKATSCHILGIRSASDTAVPLTSLAHIDSTSYDDCIRGIIRHHRDHHLSKYSHTEYETPPVRMDIHIVGGFVDKRGLSKEISNWLVHLLSAVATEQCHFIRIVLQQCAVSSLNETGAGTPHARGLAVNLHSGESYLANCDEEVSGPGLVLRSARTFAGGANCRGLYLIHHEKANEIRLQPFVFGPFPSLDHLLSLDDSELIQQTSTTPECEEQDFCQSVRKTFLYLRDVHHTSVFGNRCYRHALVFQRREANEQSDTIGPNCWTRVYEPCLVIPKRSGLVMH